jgi:hypothetical protein
MAAASKTAAFAPLPSPKYRRKLVAAPIGVSFQNGRSLSVNYERLLPEFPCLAGSDPKKLEELKDYVNDGRLRTVYSKDKPFEAGKNSCFREPKAVPT